MPYKASSTIIRDEQEEVARGELKSIDRGGRGEGSTKQRGRVEGGNSTSLEE